MPTLIRLLITLLFLAGLVYAGMIALISFVEPTPKEVTVRIPSRDLLGGGAPALPGSAPAPAAPAPVEPPPAEPAPVGNAPEGTGANPGAAEETLPGQP
ncbi:hypothetical protein [Devosia submarina]|uniref:hypothetical protein n=1 Tax=Devosia submarina TaxID=1173082 RepID=UPI003CCC1E54